MQCSRQNMCYNMYKSTAKLLSLVNNATKNQPRLYINHMYNRQLVLQPLLVSCRSYCTPNKINVEILKSPQLLTSTIPNEPKDQKQGKPDQDDPKKQRENSWRTMKYTLFAFGVSFSCLGGYLLLELGKPPLDSEGTPVRDEYSELPLYQQYFYRTLKELDYYNRMIKEPSRDKLLPDPLQYPYYQPPYTLVLELTDVLVHPDWTYQTGWRFKKRPGIDQFLEGLGGVFEVVIFTAEQGMTVFPLIEALDPNNVISYKLVRDATHFIDGHHVKDLSKLNRDLNKVIAIDWNVESVKFHPENLFILSRWAGNDDDNTLLDLANFLRTIAQSEVEDVRDVLRYYNQFEDPLGTFKKKQRYLIEQQEKDRHAEETKIVPVVKRWAPGLLNKPI